MITFGTYTIDGDIYFVEIFDRKISGWRKIDFDIISTVDPKVEGLSPFGV